MAIGTPVKLGNTSSTTNVTTTQMTTLAAVAAGESIIVGFVVENATRTLSSVTDSAGNTYAIDQHLLSGTRHLYVASCHNASALASGSLITATTDANTTSRRAVWALSVSGLATSSALDKTNTNSGSGTAWSGGASGTLAQADELVVGIGTTVSTASTTADTGYTQTESFLTGGGRGISVWKIVSSTTSETPGGACGNNSWVGLTATYKAAGASTTAVGQASETDTAQSVVPLKRAAVGQPSETDTALPVTGRKIVHLGIAVEADTARPITTTGGTTPVGQASEADSALPVVPLKRAAIGQASSTETALPITARKVIAVGIATETDEALGITGAPHIVVLGIAVETDTAIHITAALRGPPVGGGSGEGVGPETLPSIGLIPGRRALPGVFRLSLTTLHQPETAAAAARPAYTLARLTQFTEARVEIPANDSRIASAKISLHDPAIDLVQPYSTLLHVLYVTASTAWNVFWGVISNMQENDDETVTLNCVDRSLSLQRHFLRYGDQAVNGTTHPTLPNPYGKGHVPLDSTGMAMLLAAGQNTDEQDDRGVPALGIILGTDNTSPTSETMEVRRGDEVWRTMLDLVRHDIAPDFELEPIDTVDNVYAQINFYTRQGDPDPENLILQHGFGKDNARIRFDVGGKIATHAHVLSTGDEKRVTVADAAASDDIGVYVDWDATDYATSETAALQARGRQITDQYAEPPEYFDVDLTDDSGLYYMEDFTVGSACRAQKRIRRAPVTGRDVVRQADGHITKVTLEQIDTAGSVVPRIEAALTAGTGAIGDDEEI